MTTTRLMIIDDGQGVFTPLTDLRAVFELRTGMHTTLKRIEQLTGLKTDALQVPNVLQAVVRARHPKIAVNQDFNQPSDWLVVNGRCCDHQILKQVATLELGESLQQTDQTLIGARVSLTQNWNLPAKMSVVTTDKPALMSKLWEIHNFLHGNLMDDIHRCPIKPIEQPPPGTPAPGSPRPGVSGLPGGVIVFGEHVVKVHPSAKLQPGVILNSEAGPIVIDANALVESPSVIQGPCYVGKGAMVAPMTQLRGDTVIGPVCKVAGEIKASIIAGYSNKAHGGYLGNALMGYWVNLGADTTASNLKNTYTPVRMQLAPNEPREDTGLANLGPVIGDYVRTGIATCMPTGTVIGTGTMIAQSTFIATCVPPMGFITDRHAQVYEAEKFIQTANTIMGRRGDKLTPAEEDRLRDLARDAAGYYC